MCSSDDTWEMGQGGFRNDFSCLKGELSPVLKPWGLILILLLLLLLLKLLGCHQLIKLYRFQVYNFIHIIWSLPKFKSPSVTIYPPCSPFYLSPPPFPSVNHHTVVCVFEFLLFCLISSPLSLSPPTSFLSDSCQSVLCNYGSASILFVSLFCSLDSTCK